MITCDDAIIEKMILHKVGNKVNNEPLKLSQSEFALHGEISNILIKYFTNGFRSPITYRLAGESGIEGNRVGKAAKAIFEDHGELYSQSVEIAKYLYEVSEHPNIKSGELYVVLLNCCFVEGETVDALGIFKSENRETYLKVFPKEEGFDIESDSGININKLDKGCIIYNKESEEGFVAQVVDMSNRGNEAAFWTDNFLGLEQRQDAYFNTQHTIEICTACNYTTQKTLPKADHTYDNACDPECNVCKATRSVSHKYSQSWSTSKTEHWHECTVCGDFNHGIFRHPV